MSPSEEDKLSGRLHGEQPAVEPEGMGLRLLHVVLIWIMLNLAQTVLTVATVVQMVILLANRGRANERLADFGTDLGVWMAKAARYQTAASQVKPWPWTELD